MRILKYGPDKSVTKEKVCPHCGATLEYVPNDVKKYSGTDYSGGPDGREWIVCAACGKEITLKRW